MQAIARFVFSRCLNRDRERSRAKANRELIVRHLTLLHYCAYARRKSIIREDAQLSKDPLSWSTNTAIRVSRKAQNGKTRDDRALHSGERTRALVFHDVDEVRHRV